jgi:hypothetical protein
MSIKTYVVRSATLNDSWIVKADSVKGAIIETLAHLHNRLKSIENKAEGDIDLELKVSELKDLVTSIRNIGNE